MPKYTPSIEDMPGFTPCAICGLDTGDNKKETCSELCAQQWQCFKEDYEWMMLKDLDDALNSCSE